jgi:hypothetical protein
LAKSALEVAPELLDWFQGLVGKDLVPLSPEDWFEKGHDIHGWEDPKSFQYFPYPVIKQGKYLWAPPPGAADVALEELRKARHKRQESLHVFVCPRLLSTKWFRQLHKACDIVLRIPAGTTFWSLSNFEPLIVGICFPFLRSKPWQLKGTPKMFEVARRVSKMWVDSEVDARDLLLKLLQLCRRLVPLPEHVVSRALYFKG